MSEPPSDDQKAENGTGEGAEQAPPQSALPEDDKIPPAPAVVTEYVDPNLPPLDSYDSYSFEFSEASIPPPSWAKQYEELAEGTFQNVFLPAYIEERRLIREEVEFSRARDADLREQFRTDQARKFHLAQRGQTMGFIALAAVLAIVFVIALIAVLKGDTTTAVAALGLLGVGGIGIVLVRAIIFEQSKQEQPKQDRSKREGNS